MENKKASNKSTLIILGLFSLMTGLSGSSVTLALPQLSEGFHVTNGAATWAVLIGVITTAVFLVLFGHFGDLLSKEDVFLYGGIGFTLGSLISGVAPVYSILLVGRFVQAIGTAMIMANSMVIVTEAFPASARGKAIAAVSMFISVGTVSGPAIGGLILSVSSWRWIFLINVPLAILLTFFGCRFLFTTKITMADLKSLVKKSNWRGQLIFTVGMIIFFMSSLFFQSHKPNITLGAIFLVIGTIVTIFSFVQDNRSKYPWVDPSVTKNKQFMGAVMTMFLVMMVNVVSNILLPFYLQSFIGLSPLTSGLLMVLQSATMFFVTPLAGYLADKMNRHVLTIFGTTILTLSQLGYAFYPSGVNYIIIILPIILNGIGMATFLSPNNAL